jgi:uncharacterized protein YneF (UPF0154 family)
MLFLFLLCIALLWIALLLLIAIGTYISTQLYTRYRKGSLN